MVQLVQKYGATEASQQVVVDKTDSGAPLLTVDGRSVYCSITHKSGCIAAAYSSTNKIGIDLEDLSTNKDYQRIRDHYKDGFLAGSALTKKDFFHHWTLAEAFAKASGASLLNVLESPLHHQKKSATYFQIHPFLLCAYQEPSVENNEIALHQLDSDNQ
ncbi:4'-phosphopantetheinyl transferase superfamily protein [Idiomarina sp. HP20-50]|uniref:4'-phosphopantetheinyl transferase superfamily protein n=1 Tax=Idiomarina sp. HP20-50 TaxID=3070813 RepID=UPI00294B6B11|nr:4'-phosphopantetheinyl transferase superfamily protein [Idiomarina sp. HP20-50]MDV6316407.1 4'-phosphopantetheinyl transferase superfamily protein [Idiomarina sp. HP20-50]